MSDVGSWVSDIRPPAAETVATVSAAGTWSLTVLNALSDGSHTVKARADSAGNQSLDRPPPPSPSSPRRRM